jgi:hypothetical protein
MRKWLAMRVGTLLILFCTPPMVLGLSDLSNAADSAVDFDRDIRPLLSNYCFTCHGPDESERQGGLRLDVREGALGEADSGEPAIVPGEPDQSELIARITSDDEFERMPPPETGKTLSAREQQLLAQWIREGAPYAAHWSYVPPRRPALPDVAATAARMGSPDPARWKTWPRNEIDVFILDRLLRESFQPSPEADRYTLIRRVTLDLTGLPPTLEEVDQFVRDPDPKAYERLVDRLLAAPAFGEHWARRWLDLARYADSAGYADDPPRTIWAYRDWVIRALNENLPFDQFTILQLAGDLLPEPTDDHLIATAFHRNTMTNNEGGTNDEEFRNVAVVDRVNTTMAVWMGTTIDCAQCHSHKYDPISQEEYFQLFAILNQTEDADRTDESPVLQLVTDDQQPMTTVPIMRELPDEQRRRTFVQLRGNYLDLGAEVTAGLPAVFPAPPADQPMNRLTLAHWLVAEDNPLTARVVANRDWETLFGRGIVATSEEFGSQGERPTHPELLDWLATELVRLEWDRKAFLKRLVTSATYRQSSRVDSARRQRDPDNRWLSRGPRFRMPAEMVRDQALHIAGLLSDKMYGSPVKPPQPASGLSAAFGSGIDWETSTGEDRYRRGLYTMWRRSNPYPSMTTFDAPSREICTIRRDRTNTPLQALVTLNDPVYVEAAQALARRMTASGETTAERATRGFRLCVARPPSDAELLQLTELHAQAHQAFVEDADAARQLATVPLGPAADGADLADLAAWTVVANVLLNLDETLMKR